MDSHSEHWTCTMAYHMKKTNKTAVTAQFNQSTYEIHIIVILIIIFTRQPDLRSTPLRSSSKSSAVYLLWTFTWKTLRPFIQATKRDNVVLPDPLTPISSRWPWGWRKIRSMRSTWSSTSSNSTSGTSSSSS